MTKNYPEFNKYKTRGADYHWRQISTHFVKRNAFVLARYQNCWRLIKQHLQDFSLKDKKILDLGCGDGAFSYLLCQQKAIVTGIDTNQQAIDFAKQQHKKLKTSANFLSMCEGGGRLPFADNSFDIVISTDVIEHVPDTDTFLQEIKRVVKKPGGIILISTPIRFTKNPLDKMHYQEWFYEDFFAYLSLYFKNIKLIKSHALFWFELYNKNIFTRIFINLLSFVYNPFLATHGWKNYSLQFALIVI